MENLIIIASLSCVRTICCLRAEEGSGARDHLVEDLGHSTLIKRVKQSEVVSDQSGRFSQNAPQGRQTGMSYGERTHLEEELEQQALQQVSERIIKVVSQAGCPRWTLFYPQVHLDELLRGLPSAVRECLIDSHGGDLTKLPLAELEQRILEK
jgi:hypothetical protein